MVRQPFDFKPGDRKVYYNYGSMLLGHAVTNVTKKPYLKFLEEEILEGLDVQLYETEVIKHQNDRIIQESLEIGPDPMNPLPDAQVSGVHGGGGAIKEECAAAFAPAASASTIAKFVSKYAAGGTGRRSPSYRTGNVEGARVYVQSRKDFDWAVTLNTRDLFADEEYRELINVKTPKFLDTYKTPPSSHDGQWGVTLTCNPDQSILYDKCPGVPFKGIEYLPMHPDTNRE